MASGCSIPGAKNRSKNKQVRFQQWGSDAKENQMELGNGNPDRNPSTKNWSSGSNKRKWQRHRRRNHSSNAMGLRMGLEDDASPLGHKCRLDADKVDFIASPLDSIRSQLELEDPKLCKLCSAEGDIFEVQASLLCRHSTLACDLLEDQEDDEIPLPEVGSESLRLLVDFCKSNRHPGILRSQGNLPCDLSLGMSCELMWAAKLLNMKELQASVGMTVSQQVEQGNFGSPPFHSIPIGLLHTVALYSARCVSHECLCNLISSVGQRATSEHNQSAVEAIAPHLDHKFPLVVSAAVTALQEIGTEHAQLALLTHPKYTLRLQALPTWSQANCKTLNVILDVIFKELQNPCWLFRVTAIQALGRVSQKGDVKATSELVQKLADPVREVRDAAVSALQLTADSDDPETISALTNLVSVSEWPVQCAALRALSIVAPGNPKLVESVAERLEDGGETGATVMKHTASRILRDVRLSMESPRPEPCSNEFEMEEQQTSPSSAAGGLRRPRGPAWCDANSDDEEALWPSFMQPV